MTSSKLANDSSAGTSTESVSQRSWFINPVRSKFGKLSLEIPLIHSKYCDHGDKDVGNFT